MSHIIRLNPSHQTFTLDGNSSILNTALEKGLNINYGCINGKCGKCKAKLISGKTQQIEYQDFIFSELEKHQAYFLMCTHTAISNITIEAQLAATDSDISNQDIMTKLKKINPVTKLISTILLQTPRTNTLRFLAGQNVKLTINDISAYYPIASCPCDDRNIEFHINNNNSEFNKLLLHDTKIGSPVKVTGPYGRFKLQDNPHSPTIFIAIDTGFAPIKSLIEHAISLEYQQAMHLILITTHGVRHYYHNLCRSWHDAFDNFNYIEINYESEQKGRQHDELNKNDQNTLINDCINHINNKIEVNKEFYFYISASKNMVNNISQAIIKNYNSNKIQIDYMPS